LNSNNKKGEALGLAGKFIGDGQFFEAGSAFTFTR
jgi:hypothetical protein